ncbi:hypothetical protein EC973_005239 [Apophysomyces ossiformis]|uniref:Tetratricopeptide repeat protein 7 N-terminal domain-containing protein n=1 Tax=Apophysomyces ossiformis TaxID=679940 RepID=A0A8H7BZ52_9FUNG|nr:hypothetical protein EC973_005239 [Apophysomyces ossiformis]
MESVSKQQQSAAELDAARCQAQWAAIPDLAKRYKKYHPKESVLETTCRVEAEFEQLIQQVQPKHDQDLKDDHLALPTPLNSGQAQSILRRLQQVISDQLEEGKELTTPDDWQAQMSKIVLAKVHYEMGKYAKALGLLQDLILRAEDVSSGYGLVLLVQARAIKGICFETENNLKAAIEAHDAAWDAVENSTERGEVLSSWIEECLYRGVLLSVKSSATPQQTLKLMRAYTQLASSWSSDWRMYKRWIVFRHYGKYLIESCKKGTYVPVTGRTLQRSSAFEELDCLMNLFRQLLASLLPSLNAKQQSEHVLELANLMIAAHDQIGWGEISHVRRVLQFLYQAKERTFNNPCISRYIFFALMRLGNFDEAKYAFRTYAELVGLKDLDKEDEFDLSSEDAEDKADLFFQRESAEDVQNVVKLFLVAVDLHGRLGLARTAARVANIALSLAQQKSIPSVLAECHRIRGCAFGLLASQVDDPELRSGYHTQSEAALQKAIELEDESWQAYYELALQQAHMRNISAATASIIKSIQLQKHHLGSWHLLAILSSCGQYDKLPQALQIIQTGLTDVQLDLPAHMHPGTPFLSWTGEDNASKYFDQAYSYIMVRVSQVRMLEMLEGSEAVLKLYANLFHTYASLTQQLGITSKPTEESPTVKPHRESRSRSFSMYSRRRANSSASASPARNDRVTDDEEELVPKPSNSENNRTDASSVTTASSRSFRKKSLQLIDLGLAKRIGSSNGQNNVQLAQEIPSKPGTNSTSTSFSLASVLSQSMSSMRSNSFTTTTTLPILPIFKECAFMKAERLRWHRLLVQLWAMCTSSYVKAGRLEEASKAILEAEQLGPDDAEVWHTLGVLCLKADEVDPHPELQKVALEAFNKALTMDSYHVETHLHMAKIYMTLDHWELAEGLLERITRSSGWDCSEAWYYLGKIHQRVGRLEQAKESFLYALELSETTPAIQSFPVFPRFVS